MQSFVVLALLVCTYAVKNDPALPAPSDRGIIELNPQNWQQVVMSAKYDVVVEFYSPYCSYCQELEPVWNELGDKFKNEDSVIISRIDYSNQANFIEGYSVRGVPTIMIFPAGKKSSPNTFHAQRTLNNFIQWIMQNAEHKVDVPVHMKSLPRPEKSDKPVVTVVGETWQEIVMNKEKDVFVNFFAPWCPYSQRLTPIWANLAEKMKPHPRLVIADFDGTANEVPGLTLHAFPTTTLYRAKDKSEFQYRGPTRSVEAYEEWLRATVPDAFSIEDAEKTTEEIIKSVKEKEKANDDAHFVSDINDEDLVRLTTNPKANVAILFYANWDEHKEEQKDIWDDIALDYQFIRSFDFYQMEAANSERAGVSVFPTVKLYPAPKYPGVQALKQDAARGVESRVAQLESATLEAGAWHKNQLEIPPENKRFRKSVPWRKMTRGDRQKIIASGPVNPAKFEVPKTLEFLFSEEAATDPVVFKGDLTIPKLKEFIHQHGNPTQPEILTSLAVKEKRNEGDPTPSIPHSDTQQAYQTIIYKEDL